jgi:hypothetical protein
VKTVDEVLAEAVRDLEQVIPRSALTRAREPGHRKANGHDSSDTRHTKPAQGPAEVVERPRLFTPVAIDDVELSAEPAWTIRRLLPARGLSSTVGPPKSRKSFLMTDALFAVARGVQYAGRDTLQGPVFYLTGEGSKPIPPAASAHQSPRSIADSAAEGEQGLRLSERRFVARRQCTAAPRPLVRSLRRRSP